MNGKMLKAKTQVGFELGHIIIEKEGKSCTCGNKGCFEAYASMNALKDNIKNIKNIKELTGKEMEEIIKNNIVDINDIIEEFITNLKIGLTSHINVFEPEAIAIGGSFVYYEDILLKRLINKMEEENLTFNRSRPKILIAKCGNNAGIIGATLT